MKTHCYDGPIDTPEPKRTIQISSMSQLRRVVDQLIESGDVDVNLQISPLLFAHMEEVQGILERIITHHPASKEPPNAQAHRQAQAQAETAPEVVSYPEHQEHRGVRYEVHEAADGFRVSVAAGCAGMMEPWDCPFQDYEDAALHGRAYIDSVLDAPPGE